jgi:hypothetical protein
VLVSPPRCSRPQAMRNPGSILVSYSERDRRHRQAELDAALKTCSWQRKEITQDDYANIGREHLWCVEREGAWLEHEYFTVTHVSI